MRHQRRPLQRENPYLLSYSDLMAALLLVFMMLLTVTMLGLKQELEASKEKAERITIIKDKIIEELKRAFAEEGLTIEVDSGTGAIKFPSDVFFDVGSSELTEEGRQRIDQLLPIYFNILLDQRFAHDVTQIIIEGHTDPSPYWQGKLMHEQCYIDNLGLSLERAQCVLKYVLNSNYSKVAEEKGLSNLMTEADRLKVLLTASGFSFSHALDRNGKLVREIPFQAISTGTFDRETSIIDFDKSRRVEFKFRLNDEEYLREIREILYDTGVVGGGAGKEAVEDLKEP